MGHHWVTFSRLKSSSMNNYRSNLVFYSTLSILFFFFFFFFFLVAIFHNTSSTSTFSTNPTCLVFRCQMMAAKPGFLSQVYEKTVGKSRENDNERKPAMSLARVRRILSGLGSSPPRCIWKCGRCTPCKPVHVSVPPGTPVTTEYYPEAWRCKCGNRLYMP